jgi:hypothetical protein
LATRDQSAYRWRNDDGSETTATWAAALNTSLSGLLDHNYRLRFVTSLGGVGSLTWTPKIQYNKNTAGWNDVNASSSVARSSDSPLVADNVATTGQIAGSISAGRFDDDNGAAETSVSLSDAGNTDTEHEFCFQIRSADVTGGDQIQFRLITTGGGTYEGYSHIPVFNVTSTYDKGQFLSFFE